ncbi:PAS domain-containing protein [Nocardioides aurantiacus]|uniref:PAS domain-containing protein n=1 Tax=Nocardioides aurantiacus TaxID=86796 RepID=UPI000F492F52
MSSAGGSAGGDDRAPPLLGRYTYHPSQDRWWWSEGMFAIHGLEPGEKAPDTQFILSHIHPDDLALAWQSREDALTSGTPFTFPHRIIRPSGALRTVIAAGQCRMSSKRHSKCHRGVKTLA